MSKRSFWRALIIFASAGWIVPLSLAFAWSYDFIWRTYQIAHHLHPGFPFHPYDFVPWVFLGSMLWLATVIVGWTLFLTRRRL